jgi:hypothetical protein
MHNHAQEEKADPASKSLIYNRIKLNTGKKSSTNQLIIESFELKAGWNLASGRVCRV